jgi:HCO3- transporter family.
LTLSIATVTYGTATVLKGLRNTVYFTKSIRNNVSNFAPTIGVVLGSLLARSARLAHGAEALLPALAIPAKFQTTSGRPWLVPIMDLPMWARFASFVPALMATVLLFLDQNITVRLVNNPSYKMEKGRRKGIYWMECTLIC